MQKIKDYIYYNRKEIIIVLIGIVLFIIYYLVTNNEKGQYIENDKDIIKEVIEEKEEIKEEVVVDIKGEVKNPGTYVLNNDKRVIDIINEAGGLTDKGSTNDINLSEKIYDEMLIIIPSKEGQKEDNKEVNNQKTNKETNSKISINNASLEELMTIKGIGETKAKKIIEYRNKNGKFKSLEDLTNVSGIGNKTFEKIKNYIKL